MLEWSNKKYENFDFIRRRLIYWSKYGRLASRKKWWVTADYDNGRWMLSIGALNKKENKEKEKKKDNP